MSLAGRKLGSDFARAAVENGTGIDKISQFHANIFVVVVVFPLTISI